LKIFGPAAAIDATVARKRKQHIAIQAKEAHQLIDSSISKHAIDACVEALPLCRRVGVELTYSNPTYRHYRNAELVLVRSHFLGPYIPWTRSGLVVSPASRLAINASLSPHP